MAKAKAITMHHAQSGRTQRASRDAFDQEWSQEGWELVDDPAPTPARKAPAKEPAAKTTKAKPDSAEAGDAGEGGKG